VRSFPPCGLVARARSADWDASESDLSHLVRGGKVTTAGVEVPEDKKITNDNLWQDNWDGARACLALVSLS
jgi:hypothetical protein